jgi:chromosome segregation ATPase
MISVKKVIDRLNDSPAKITQKLTTLNEERERLLSKLKDVEASIRLEEDNLARVPTSLSEQKKKMLQLKSDLQSIKAKKNNPVPRTAEEDNQQIVDVDSMLSHPVF